MASVLAALPDPAFLLSRSGKYVAVFGGSDARYYHNGSGLVGLYIADLIAAEKADWFLAQIDFVLSTKKLLIVEYELSNKDVKGLSDAGPAEPIWFEGRIQPLDFLVDGEPLVLWVASNISARHTLELKLREQSELDQLTGLFNRRGFMRHLMYHFESFQRHATPTALLMIDLDGFKKINDTYGHQAGDNVLILIAGICRNQLRKTDTAARLGGDEFVIILPNTSQQQALQFADRLCARVASETANGAFGAQAVSISVGVSSIMAEDKTTEQTMKRVDNALYKAKRSGRNRVMSA